MTAPAVETLRVPDSAPMVRPARPDDIPSILGFWNPIIRETTVTFASDEKTEAGLLASFAERRAGGHEFFVAEDAGGRVVGLATYAQFRGGNGYARAMEHTIILAPEARGRGAGRALMKAVEEHARAGGAHSMIAAVSAENDAGIAFHAAVGYPEVARIPEVGFKFGRWLDLVIMQKML